MSHVFKQPKIDQKKFSPEGAGPLFRIRSFSWMEGSLMTSKVPKYVSESNAIFGSLASLWLTVNHVL